MTADPLPAPGYTELLGCPVADLDELIELADRARAGQLSLPEWRRRDAAVRATWPTAPAPPAAAALRRAATDALLAADEDLHAEPSTVQQLELLSARAFALLPSCDDASLRARRDDLLRRIERLFPRAERWRRPEDEARHADLLARAVRLQLWLEEGTPRDVCSGLTAAAVAAHRTERLPVLGEVPVSPAEARWRAWQAASELDRAAAATFPAGPYRRDDEAQLRHSARLAAARRDGLLSLLTAAIRGLADPALFDPAVALLLLWQNGRLCDLVAAQLGDD